MSAITSATNAPSPARTTTPPATESLVMSKRADGSISVPDFGVASGPRTTGRFSYDIGLEHRASVPMLKQAIDGIAKLTGTSISTDIKTIGFHQGEVPVSGVVAGPRSGVLAAMTALDEIKQQLDGSGIGS